MTSGPPRRRGSAESLRHRGHRHADRRGHGIDVLEAALTGGPTKVIIDHRLRHHGVAREAGQGRFEVIAKPFKPEDLQRAIARAFERDREAGKSGRSRTGKGETMTIVTIDSDLGCRGGGRAEAAAALEYRFVRSGRPSPRPPAATGRHRNRCGASSRRRCCSTPLHQAVHRPAWRGGPTGQPARGRPGLPRLPRAPLGRWRLPRARPAHRGPRAAGGGDSETTGRGSPAPGR